MKTRSPAPRVQNPEDLYQRENRTIVGSISSNPLLQGQLVENVDLKTTVVRVGHGLDRPPVGFFIVRASADVRAWIDATSSAPLSSQLPLIASAAATVSLWIF